MTEYPTADLVDQLVALYAERVARGEDPRAAELLARAPRHRDELLRCFRMIDGELPGEAAGATLGGELGDFRILRELGRGGMAVVYEAEQRSLRRVVALKVLRNHLTIEPRHVERFQREARASAKLAHPNVVPIHAVGVHDGHAYIAFELVRGPTLAAVVAALRALGRRPHAGDLARASGAAYLASSATYAEACVRLLRGVFDAIAFAHSRGVIHRDLKPSNLLFGLDGEPVVADFGLAKDMGETSLSITGETLGTPHYMSPEQAGALWHRVDERTDVYSLGVTLYELLTLSRPFEGDTLQQIVERIATADVPNPHEVAPDLDRGVGDVVVKALAKDPVQRYASVQAFREDLELALRGAQTAAAPTTGIGAVLQRWFDAMANGTPFEYRSRTHLVGLPLVHIVSGIRDPLTRRPKFARGLIAIGDYAIGGYAGGKFAIGLVALGGIAIGPIALGAAALGYVALGGIALGGDVTGLIAGGYEGIGVLAESVARPRGLESLRFDTAARGGPPLEVLMSFTGAVLSFTMTHGIWRKRATTAAAVSVVNLVARVCLPLACSVPALTYAAGIEVTPLLWFGYLFLVSLVGSWILRKAVAPSAARE